MSQVILSITFSILLACLLLTIVSGLYIFMHNIKRTNDVMKHPYLDVLPWQRLSLSNKTAILMDYFFRLFMPYTKFGLIGHANKQLAHVDPAQVPFSIKWPVLGFWGGCFLGILATIVVWVSILFIMPAA